MTAKEMLIKLCDSVVADDPPFFWNKWQYDDGVKLKGVEAAWRLTGKQEYFDIIKKYADNFIDEEGNIPKYHDKEYNIDHLNNGKNILFLYNETKDPRYLKVLKLMRNQIKDHPRIETGGFWHKNIYPHQMWLDGLFMGQPFYAEYSKVFNEPENFDDIANQFYLMAKYSYNEEKQLFYHAYDHSREQRWANKETGCSPNFWGRSIGWFGMAIVDTLDYFPADHKGRAILLDALNKVVGGIKRYQDPQRKLWWQLVDRAGENGNYIETSCSAMFVYVIAKAVLKGYIDKSYLEIAESGFKALVETETSINEKGHVVLHHVCEVAGLGAGPGAPPEKYRTGTPEYYYSEPVIDNDGKGYGAFINVAAVMAELGK